MSDLSEEIEALHAHKNDPGEWDDASADISVRKRHDWDGTETGQWSWESCKNCGVRRSHGFVGSSDDPIYCSEGNDD